MAVLNAADRSAMPKKDFAGPGKSFPISDPTHARMAISGATRSEHAGNISMSEEEKIKAAARAKLHGGDPKGGMEHHKAAIAKMHPARAFQRIADQCTIATQLDELRRDEGFALVQSGNSGALGGHRHTRT